MQVSVLDVSIKSGQTDQAVLPPTRSRLTREQGEEDVKKTKKKKDPKKINSSMSQSLPNVEGISGNSKEKKKKKSKKKSKKAKKSRRKDECSLMVEQLHQSAPSPVRDWGNWEEEAEWETNLAPLEESRKEPPVRNKFVSAASSGGEVSLDPRSVFGKIDTAYEKHLFSEASAPVLSTSNNTSMNASKSDTHLFAESAPALSTSNTTSLTASRSSLNSSSGGNEQISRAERGEEADVTMPSLAPSRQSNLQQSNIKTEDERLVAMYLVGTGTDRETADRLAAQFVREDTIRDETAKAISLKATVSPRREEPSKSSMMASYRPPQRNMVLRDLADIEAQRLSTKPERVAMVEVEATPVSRDIEMPVAYAESAPLSFKYMLKERRFRRVFVLILLVLGGIMAFVWFFIIPTVTESSSDQDVPTAAPTFISQEVMDAALELSDQNDIIRPGSPQHMAVGWMSTFDEHEFSSQRYTLVVLAFSLSSEDWFEPGNFLDPTLHECSWSAQAISCGGGISNPVIGIDMTRFGLRGTLPDEIGLLSDLISLKMPKNPLLTGTIPEVFGNLTNLAMIDLSSSNLEGSIPNSIGSGEHDLRHLDLSGNRLISTLPDEMFNLRFLRRLYLSSNQLSGTLSASFKRFRSLLTLDLRHNQFTGHFNLDLGAMDSLDEVLVDYNQMTGPLPVANGNLVMLKKISLSNNMFVGNVIVNTSDAILVDPARWRLHHVDLSNNRLSGHLSQIVSNLQSLRHVDFSGNFFTGVIYGIEWSQIEYYNAANNLLTGVIPSVWPTSMKYWDVSDNMFDQGIPEAICNHTQLEFVIVSNNDFDSTIPLCLGGLTNLRDLEMGDAKLHGTLPSSLSLLSKIEIMFAHGNDLTGTMPSEYGDLRSMKQLRLDNNRLQGTIPATLKNLQELRLFNISYNDFAGELPQELAQWTKLENISLTGNEFLWGSFDKLCMDSLSVSISDVGCSIECGCCTGDYDTECGG